MRYVVGSLGTCCSVHAGLVSAIVGVALCSAFSAVLQILPMDLNDLLKKVRIGAIKELTLSDVTLLDGMPIAQA